MIERDIFHNGMLVVTQCSGILTPEELNIGAMWMVQNFGTLIKPGFSHLFNAIEADTYKLTDEDIHRVAHINISFAEKRGEFTTAIVAKEPHSRQLAQLHMILSSVSGIKVGIFSDVDAAYKWLGFKEQT